MAREMSEPNRRIVERFITEGVLEGRLDVFEELCDPCVINHAAAPQAREGIDALKRVIGFSRAAMPDQRWTDRVLVADEGYVVVRAVRESTWSAESFLGFATPRGVTTAVEMVHIWRLAHGKIVGHWAVRDDLALMMQLGVVKSGYAAPGTSPGRGGPFGASLVWDGCSSYGLRMDGFGTRHADLLTGSYDCVDRIVLNAYYPLGHHPSGFRVWWRRWHDDGDDSLDDAHLMRLAGRFARRVRGWASAHGVPVIDCAAGGTQTPHRRGLPP